MSTAGRTRRRIVELDIGLSLRLDVRVVRRQPSLHPFEIREIQRDDLLPVLGSSPALYRATDQLDLVAPAGWRCFVAFDGAAPAHVSFVEMRSTSPLLFGSVTERAARGRGAFRAVVHYAAERMREAGQPFLYSSVGSSNRASLRAHAAAGFVVVGRRIDVRALGLSLRSVARRLVHRRGARR